MVEEREKTMREVIREEVTAALRLSHESKKEERRVKRVEYEEGFMRISPSGREQWEPKEGPPRYRASSKWSSSPSPLPGRHSSLPPRRSPAQFSRRPTSRPARREERSAHSVDRRQARPSRPLPRRSPSPASHRPRDSSRRFRGERDPHRRREASPVDRARPRRPSPTRSSKSSGRQEPRSWRKERSSQ